MPETRQLIRAILEAVPGTALLADADGLVLEASPSACQLLRREQHELQGLSLEALVHARYRPMIAHRLGRGTPGGWMAPGPFEVRIEVGEDQIPAEVAISELPNGQRVCFLRDLSHRRRLEEDLALQASVVESMAEGVCLVRASDLTILYANPHFEHMMGYGSGELDGRPITQLDASPQDRPEIVHRLDAEGEAAYEIENLRKDGSRILCSVRTTAVNHPTHGRVFVSVRQDVTRQRQAEETLRAFNEMLERQVAERSAAAEERSRQLEVANQELEAFSYSVSHDLRASLRAVAGYSEMLAERLPETLPEEDRRLLDQLVDSAQRMGQIIEGLLTLSRVGRTGLNLLELDMTALARAALLELEPQEGARTRDVAIGDLPPARGDSVLMRLVFMNLLSNAIKFTRGVERPRIEVGGEGRGDERLYFVKDNGAGFPPRYSNRLFQAFQRLHSADEFEGSGIGLATVERIITRHGGRVWAEGEPGRGATFWFSLPATEEA